MNYGNGIKNNKPGGNISNFKIWYRIVKYFDSLSRLFGGKSESPRSPNLPAFVFLLKLAAVKKATDGQSETEMELKLLEKAV